MKYILITLLFISTGLTLNSDNNHYRVRLNIIVFLDGKIIKTRGHFEYKNRKNQINQIPFEGTIGEMHLKKNDYNTLKDLKLKDSLCLVINHIPFSNDDIEVYKGKIFYPNSIFNDFTVIRITNLNKRKNNYYFGISTPSVITPFIPQEYNMFEVYEDD